MTSASILLDYQQRIEQLQIAIGHLQTRQGLLALILALAIVGSVWLGFLAFVRRAVPAWYPALFLPFATVSVYKFTRNRLAAANLSRIRRYYAKGTERLEERWMGNGCSGEEFEPANHVYAADLDLFGPGSLFERICTARTQLGRERLAQYLLQPAPMKESHERQEAVRELTGRDDLRQKIALLGNYDFQDSRWQTFIEWLDSPPTKFNVWMWARPIMLATSAVLAVLLTASIIVPSVRSPSRPWLMLIITGQSVIGLCLRKRVRRVIEAAVPVAAEIGIVREGLELLSAETFRAPKLSSLARSARPSLDALRMIVPWFTVLRERTKDWFYLPSLLLLLGTQSAIAIEAWRVRYREELKRWLGVWSEFEALNCLAGYAYENPEDCWPEMVDREALFEASDLGHPILPRKSCVRNNVSLGDACRYFVVSGSNMAGKSTLLRAIGVTCVLAFAGAPVRARALRLAMMRVCASISIVDSLREGRSKFLAEVERIRDTLRFAEAHAVIFLIDEIFSGTNSPDRRAAADAVVRTLTERKAIGAIATHDIALAAIAEHGGTNMHMASREGTDNPLDFDYRLKVGAARESNALAIARMAGVPI